MLKSIKVIMLTWGDDLSCPDIRNISLLWFVSPFFLMYETEVMTTLYLVIQHLAG